MRKHHYWIFRHHTRFIKEYHEQMYANRLYNLGEIDFFAVAVYLLNCVSLWPHGLNLLSSSVHKISQQEYWNGLPFPSPGDLPNPGIESVSAASPAWEMDSLPRSHLGSPLHHDQVGFILGRKT